jgi:hypothetical protein
MDMHRVPVQVVLVAVALVAVDQVAHLEAQGVHTQVLAQALTVRHVEVVAVLVV